MADLNALIAEGYQVQAPTDPFARHLKMQQLDNAALQNQLTQQQLLSAKSTSDQNLAAQTFVNGIMAKAKESGADVNDPMDAAKQMLMHPNPTVQAMGKHLAEAYQLIQGINQQQRYEQRTTGSAAPVANPAAAPTAAYAPTSTLGTLGGPTQTAVPMAGAMGSGTFDVNAPAAPVANALAPKTLTVNALAKPSAVTAESIADQIRQGNADFGNTPGWVKDREILMKQYEALLNPRQRTFASINPADYTQESIRAFNASGDQADLVPRAPKGEKVFSNLNPADYTSESIKAFNVSGDYSDLVPRSKDEKPIAAKMHVVGKNLVDETGKVVFKAEAEPGAGVPKAPAGYRVTATGDLEAIPGGPAANKPMTDLQKQAYKKDFAADTYKIKSAVDTANELETLTDTLVGNPDKGVKAHPGLRGITGYAGVLPSLPSGDAAKAEQKLDTFKGKIKALGRSIASQDGKLGNMAVQEWQFISDAVQAINPRAGNLDEQMRDVVRQAKQLAKNMQGKFDLTYEEAPPVVGAPAPKPVARGALSPAEEAELAQLRKRFGK